MPLNVGLQQDFKNFKSLCGDKYLISVRIKFHKIYKFYVKKVDLIQNFQGSGKIGSANPTNSKKGTGSDQIRVQYTDYNRC
jgi:hypothetical protein